MGIYQQLSRACGEPPLPKTSSRANFLFADYIRRTSEHGAVFGDALNRPFRWLFVTLKRNLTRYGNIRQGENSGHLRSSSEAHWAVLSIWHAVQESGIFAAKPAAGEMKRKVWE